MPRTAAQIWTDPDVIGSALLCLFLDTYGPAAADWAAETIKMEIEADCAAEVPQANIDKLLAAKTVLTTDLFYKDLPSFIHLSTVLGGLPADYETWDMAEADECAWAIAEAYMLSPPEESQGRPAFSEAVIDYVAALCRWEGMSRPPGILRIGPQVGDWDHPPTSESLGVSRDVEEFVSNRLRKLARQFEELPLQNGNAPLVAARMRKHFASPSAN